MKVLHISYWYPNQENPKEALWIKRHIDALEGCSVKDVIHLQVKTGKLNNVKRHLPEGKQHILSIPTRHWFLLELVSSLLLIYYLLRYQVNKQYDIINFHIAYPNLTYWHLIKKWVKIPVAITEHWSAYHLNFGVKKELSRIQRIFRQDIPVITVSEALSQDIKLFSKAEFPHFIVPNIVNSELFFENIRVKRDTSFFMVSLWQEPKNPFIAMEAFHQFRKIYPDYKLIIGGYGRQWKEMENWVVKYKVADFIDLVGKLSSQDIAKYMQSCTAFLHPSNYETFSVVCAEAVSCGTPVVASNVGGIPEVIGKSGIPIHVNSLEKWVTALNDVVKSKYKIENYNHQFSKATVGQQYYKALKKVINASNK